MYLFQTLNGHVAEESDDPTLFSFSTENNVTCFMKASNLKGRIDWVKDLRALLDSQLQMKKGKQGEMECVPIPCWCIYLHSMLGDTFAGAHAIKLFQAPPNC